MMKPEPRLDRGLLPGGPPSKKRRKNSARGSETLRLRADVDDGGARGLGEVDPELERGLERPVLRRVRPELGGGPARRVDVDADRDDAPEDDERDDEDDGDEPGEALGHALILPKFSPAHTLAAGAGRVAECARGEAMPGSDPGA